MNCPRNDGGIWYCIVVQRQGLLTAVEWENLHTLRRDGAVAGLVSIAYERIVVRTSAGIRVTGATKD